MICKLLTPGPLTTTERVRHAMLEDRCTWDDEYKALTQRIRQQLLDVAQVSAEDYTSILLQGSGSYVVESVLTSTVRDTDKLLIITNGAYGNRMREMAEAIGLSHVVLDVPYDRVPSVEEVAAQLAADADITHVAVVHCETTTGILNPITAIGQLVHAEGKVFIVDAMSSFGGVPIDFERSHIDFLVSSANKCIHGVPGFGFIIARRERLNACQGVSRSVSLDLYAQWETMEADGKWRFTSPTHVVGAFGAALDELFERGGVASRHAHYLELNALLREELALLGFQAYVAQHVQSPIITTFHYPHERFDFAHFYEAMKSQGFILYPGKLMEVDSFRIGNIGDVSRADMQQLITIIRQYMEDNK